MPSATVPAARVVGYARACHLGPTLAVTAVVTVVAYVAGQPVARLPWVAAAVLAGQLCVGWTNDSFDALRDIAAGRLDKPVVNGVLTRRELAIAAMLAGSATVPLSYVAAGTVGGNAHVIAVASALTYDLVLKPTVLSWLPWAVSFGAIPYFVTYGLQPPARAATWAVSVCVLLGVAAHLANAARDIDSDRAVGAAGVAAAIGARRSRTIALVLLCFATGILLSAVGLSPAVTAVTALVIALIAITAAVVASGQRLFEAFIVIAMISAVLLVVGSPSITAP